jgi:hypothetical protein
VGVIRMQRETLTEALWLEAMPLLHAHWREIAHYPDILLDVDVDGYMRCDEMGMVRCFTAREDGALVGYALFFVRPNLHYQASVQAVQDVLYLAPRARGGAGRRFIAWCDEQLAKQAIQVVYHHTKAVHNFGPMLERMGYELVDLIYAKRLDKVND